MKRRSRGKQSVNHNVMEIRSELLKENRELQHRLDYIGKHLDKLWEHVATTNDRLQDLEIYANIISRLITTICVEKIGIKLNVLKRLLRRIEKETVTDSQVNYLEELYRLEGKKRPDADLPPDDESDLSDE